MIPDCKAVLFDFDGTLADSSEGIFKSLIYAFQCDGKPAPDDATLRKFIGRRFMTALKPCLATKMTKSTG